jgi:hypothetical protein
LTGLGLEPLPLSNRLFQLGAQIVHRPCRVGPFSNCRVELRAHPLELHTEIIRQLVGRGRSRQRSLELLQRDLEVAGDRDVAYGRENGPDAVRVVGQGNALHQQGPTGAREVHHVELDGPGCLSPHAVGEVAPEQAVRGNETIRQCRAERLAQLGRSEETQGGVVDRQEHPVQANAHDTRGLFLEEANQMCCRAGVARGDVIGDGPRDQGQ